MQITAAVLRSSAAPLTLESLEIEEPRAGEVLVRVVATGVCHTDMIMRDHICRHRSRWSWATRAPWSSASAPGSPRSRLAIMW